MRIEPLEPFGSLAFDFAPNGCAEDDLDLIAEAFCRTSFVVTHETHALGAHSPLGAEA